MQLLSCHNGRLIAATVAPCDGGGRVGGGAIGTNDRGFVTGLSALDDLLPNHVFARGGIHELLALPQHPSPLFVAILLARSALMQSQQKRGTKALRHEGTNGKASSPSCLRASVPPCLDLSGSIALSDPRGTLYPPAVAAMGVPLDRLLILRPRSIADENWAIAECLRCRGLAATIAAPRWISRIEARRFQLAAERGGGAGILLRPWDRNAHIYAALTRWLIAPEPGERTVQKWKIQLIHGHGGRVGQSVILEHYRDQRNTNLPDIPLAVQAHPVRPPEQLADRPIPPAARKTA